MSYRCGTNGLQPMGIADGQPRIICDGCGLEESVITQAGFPKRWFEENRPAPKWKLVRTEDPFSRVDLCPRCKETNK
jgi:hypothetical protein